MFVLRFTYRMPLIFNRDQKKYWLQGLSEAGIEDMPSLLNPPKIRCLSGIKQGKKYTP